MNTGNNLLYLVVSALLGFMSISGILGNHNLKGLSLEIHPPEEIYDTLETLFTIRIHNERRLLHSFLLEIVFHDHYSDISILTRGETRQVTIPATLKGRGEHKQHQVTIRSRFPINFFIRSRTITLLQPVIVFPKPIYCRSTPEEYGSQKGERKESNKKGYEGDISRIMDYTGGEPLKMIHWKLSARHNTLKIKELSSTVQEPVEIDISTLPGKTLEMRLGCASFLVNAFFHSHRPVGLKLGRTIFPAACGRYHKHYLLTQLAQYGQDKNTP